MTEVWVTIAVLTVTTAAIRAAGPIIVGGRDLPGPVLSVIGLLAPALLAALVVVQTFGAPAGGALELDERIAGVAAAAVALSLRASLLQSVAIAAIVTASLRAI